jgi:hypothetical protein
MQNSAPRIERRQFRRPVDIAAAKTSWPQIAEQFASYRVQQRRAPAAVTGYLPIHCGRGP